MTYRPPTSTPRAALLRHRARLLLITLVGVVPIATASTASAAVNHCKPLVKADPAEVQVQAEEIKARYTKIFGV